MRKLILVILLSISSLFASATIFHGSIQPIVVNSEPSGADVYVDGQLMGTTPVTLQLKKGKYKTITIKKECYEVVMLQLQSKMDGVAILNVFWDLSTTDMITGNLWEYSPNSFFVKLHKDKECLKQWSFSYPYLNIKTKDNLISFILIYFNDLKNKKRINDLKVLLISSCKNNKSINIYAILKQSITAPILVKKLLERCH